MRRRAISTENRARTTEPSGARNAPWLRAVAEPAASRRKFLAQRLVSWMIPSEYAILDTSVLVAGLRSRNGASFQVLRAIRRGDIRIAVSVALVLEYEAVTLRPGMVPGFRPVDVLGILDGICLLADHQQIFFAWRPFLQDPDDDLVLELAVAASAPFVITHNTGDFRGSDSMGVRAITPAAALDLIRP